MKGKITKINNIKIWIDNKPYRYVSNATFNHSYIGDTITLLFEGEIAVDCINERHHKKRHAGY
jgi:hypothetical protein